MRYVIVAGTMHTQMCSFAANDNTSAAWCALRASMINTGCRGGERHNSDLAKSRSHSFITSFVTQEDFLLHTKTFPASDAVMCRIRRLGNTVALPSNTCGSFTCTSGSSHIVAMCVSAFRIVALPTRLRTRIGRHAFEPPGLTMKPLEAL